MQTLPCSIVFHFIESTLFGRQDEYATTPEYQWCMQSIRSLSSTVEEIPSRFAAQQHGDVDLPLRYLWTMALEGISGRQRRHRGGLFRYYICVWRTASPALLEKPFGASRTTPYNWLDLAHLTSRYRAHLNIFGPGKCVLPFMQLHDLASSWAEKDNLTIPQAATHSSLTSGLTLAGCQPAQKDAFWNGAPFAGASTDASIVRTAANDSGFPGGMFNTPVLPQSTTTGWHGYISHEEPLTGNGVIGNPAPARVSTFEPDFNHNVSFDSHTKAHASYPAASPSHSAYHAYGTFPPTRIPQPPQAVDYDTQSRPSSQPSHAVASTPRPKIPGVYDVGQRQQQIYRASLPSTYVQTETAFGQQGPDWQTGYPEHTCLSTSVAPTRSMEYQRFQRMQAEQSLPCTSVHGWHSQAPAPRQTPMPAKAAFAPSLAPSTIRQVSRQQPMFPAEYGPQTLPAKRAASSVVQQRGFRSRSICATIDRTPAFTPSLPQAPHQVSRGQPTPTPEVIEAQQPVAGCSYAAQLTLPRHPKRAASDTVHEREPKPKAARTENLAECSAPLSIGKPKGRSLHNRVLINEARRLTQTPVSGSLSSASPSVPFPALAPPVAANPLEKITLQSYTSQGAQLQANPAGRLAAGCEEQTTQVLNSVTQTETSVSQASPSQSAIEYGQTVTSSCQDASLGSRIASSDATIQNLRKTRQLLLSFDNIEFPELHRDPYTYELRCGPDVFWDLFIEQSRAVAMLMQGMKPMSRLLFSGSMQASEQCQEEFRLLPGEARDMSKLLDQLRLWAVAVNELTHGDTFAVLEGASKNTEVNSADVVPEATLDTLFAEYFDTTDCLPEPWFAVADRVREP